MIGKSQRETEIPRDPVEGVLRASRYLNFRTVLDPLAGPAQWQRGQTSILREQRRDAPQLIQDEDCEAGGHGPDHATGDATDPRFPTRSGGNWVLWKEGSVNLDEALRRNAPSRSRSNEDQRIERNEPMGIKDKSSKERTRKAKRQRIVNGNSPLPRSV
jgi:hypothetical protein